MSKIRNIIRWIPSNLKKLLINFILKVTSYDKSYNLILNIYAYKYTYIVNNIGIDIVKKAIVGKGNINTVQN